MRASSLVNIALARSRRPLANSKTGFAALSPSVGSYKIVSGIATQAAPALLERTAASMNATPDSPSLAAG